jgi:hypothetical protein
MKKVTFIAATAFTLFFNQNATANTVISETSESIMTRTETPVNMVGEDLLKITIHLHFKKFDVDITIECITVGNGGGGINGSTIEADAVMEGSTFRVVLPENVKKQLDGAQLKIVSGGTFKSENGKHYEIKSNTVLNGANPSFQVSQKDFNTKRNNKDMNM